MKLHEARLLLANLTERTQTELAKLGTFVVSGDEDGNTTVTEEGRDEPSLVFWLTEGNNGEWAVCERYTREGDTWLHVSSELAFPVA